MVRSVSKYGFVKEKSSEKEIYHLIQVVVKTKAAVIPEVEEKVVEAVEIIADKFLRQRNYRKFAELLPTVKVDKNFTEKVKINNDVTAKKNEISQTAER